jgi:hypothetical protein
MIVNIISKIMKNFSCLKIFFHLLTGVTGFKHKVENIYANLVPMKYLGAGGEIIHEKSRKSPVRLPLMFVINRGLNSRTKTWIWNRIRDIWYNRRKFLRKQRF